MAGAVPTVTTDAPEDDESNEYSAKGDVKYSTHDPPSYRPAREGYTTPCVKYCTLLERWVQTPPDKSNALRKGVYAKTAIVVGLLLTRVVHSTVDDWNTNAHVVATSASANGVKLVAVVGRAASADTKMPVVAIGCPISCWPMDRYSTPPTTEGKRGSPDPHSSAIADADEVDKCVASSCIDVVAPIAAHRSPPPDVPSAPVSQNPLVWVAAVAARNECSKPPGGDPVYASVRTVMALTAPAAFTVATVFPADA